MSAKTGISWTDSTWPIVNGCDKVSPGCRSCYALKLIATRLAHTPKYAGLAKMTAGGPVWTGEVRLWEQHLDWPLRWREPRRIFVANMGDLFHEAVPDEAIDRVFAVMALAQRHTFQVLTKRPARMRAYCARVRRAEIHAQLRALAGPDTYGITWPLPNVWLGVSVEDQATADARIPLLLQTPAVVRFVSYEPALGPVDFADALKPLCVRRGCKWHAAFQRPDPTDPRAVGVPRLDQIIIGGESGPRFREMDLAWLRSVHEQTRAAGVALLVKQDSAFKPGQRGRIPDDLWVQEFPS